MIISDVIGYLEELTPLAYAEEFDNVGLLVGNKENKCSGILVCHDALEEVIDEAVAKNCNLVVCFHPILFSGLKKITGKNYVERSIIKAIKNDIAIFAIHTALDNNRQGVNQILCDTLGLINSKILIPKQNYIYKLTTYVPKNHANELKQILFKAGAGSVGNYDECSFSSHGIGSFKGNKLSNPTIGKPSVYQEVDEIKLEFIFEKHLKQNILNTLIQNHPYEEVSYEVILLENELQNVGMGMIAELPEEMDEKEFLLMVKEKTATGGIRHSNFLNKKIKKVAVLGGSGSFAIQSAKAQKADAFITADLKYHDYYQSEKSILLADIGHFESERYIKNYIVEFLKKKITIFAIILSEINTNPVNYI